MGQTGNWMEVQIRSQRMEEIAEKGFAAYWKYKADNMTESGFDIWLKKAQDLINTESNNAIEFVDNFKLDLPRVEYWLSKGAQPSTTVASLIRRAKNPNLKQHHATPAKKVEAKKEA
jgi:(p)ppGpp synthase/HD superfamily hydrolase